MTTPIRKPHYAVEDIPPDDVDTQLALFEQSTDVVKGSTEAADWLLKNAQIVLGEVLKVAEAIKDTELAEKVNKVWGQIQSVTAIVSRQGAVIAGSKEAMAALKKQRDQIAKELNGIKKAVGENDFEHEALSDFVEALNDMWIEDNEAYYADLQYNSVYDVLHKAGMTHLEVDRFMDILKGDLPITDEQSGLLKQFLATMRDDEDVTEAESDDYAFAFDDDEDGDE